MKLKNKKYLVITCAMLSLLLVFIISANVWVERSTIQQIYHSAEKLPKNKVGLVLGTSKYTKNGYLNPYFSYRIDAAATLFKKGKIKHLLVSGDNSKKDYNEPEEMLNALLEKGVPKSAISIDYAGFRTLDSVIRSKEIFGLNQLTIISQQFHNQRALFIANRKVIKAIAYNAKDVSLHLGLKTMLREYLARCKAVLDLSLLNQQPKFLGKKIKLDI